MCVSCIVLSTAVNKIDKIVIFLIILLVRKNKIKENTHFQIEIGVRESNQKEKWITEGSVPIVDFI